MRFLFRMLLIPPLMVLLFLMAASIIVLRLVTPTRRLR